MQIENGKTYIDGLGDNITVSLNHPGTMYPFIGNNGSHYMADGRYILEDNMPVSVFRLVEEVKVPNKIKTCSVYDHENPASVMLEIEERIIEVKRVVDYMKPITDGKNWGDAETNVHFLNMVIVAINEFHGYIDEE